MSQARFELGTKEMKKMCTKNVVLVAALSRIYVQINITEW
jgi:hypothetical protein